MMIRAVYVVTLVAVVYSTTVAPPEEEKSERKDEVTTNNTKISRDSPRIAHDQGSLMATFPVVSRIRSKAKSNTLQARRPQMNGAVSGLDDQMQKLLISTDPTSNVNGAFARTPSGTGSSIYTVYGPQTTLTGEPYLSGYRGIPDTQESAAVQPNYVGALTKPSNRKHTFGSYGSIDSVKSQSWQQGPVAEQGQYVSSDYNYGPTSFEQPTTFGSYSSYSNGDYNGYNVQNPYGAAYQGGSDQNYESLTQKSYGTPYSGYGTQPSATFTVGSAQWPSQGYGSFKQENWQPQTQSKPSTWQLSQYAGSTDNYGQTNTDYGGLKVEQMPTSGYSNQDYGYGMGSGSSYGSDLYGGSTGLNTQSGGYTPSYSKPMSSYKTHNYETPIYIGQQGNTNYGSDYDDYGSSNIDGYNQQGTTFSQRPSQGYGNLGSTLAYGSGYTPTQTITGSSFQPTEYYNSGYQNPYSMSDFSNYNYGNNANDAYRLISRPGSDFSMNVGYGAQKGAASATTSGSKLTNNITPSRLIEDGYKTKSA